MAKSKKSKQKSRQEKIKQKKQFEIPLKYQYGLVFLFGFILIVIYFFPIAFQGMQPPASDRIAWQGNVQSIKEAKEKYDYTPLWANNVFAGQPAHLISITAPGDFLQPAMYIIKVLNDIFNWRIVYYFIGFAGMILLMRQWGTNIFISLFAGVGFVWWPHIVGLIEAGHNTKVRTMMMAPFIIYGLVRFLKKPDLLNMALFSIVLSIGVIAGHYQIIYYLAILLTFISIYYLYDYIKNKDWKAIGIRIGLVLIAIILTFGVSSYRVLMVQEYSKYSIRGGTGEKGSSGLELDYATQWSLAPAELMDLLAPRFHGGSSAEVYNGDDVPQLRGRRIPGYWGEMPFTSSTEYIGVVIIFLAFISLIRIKEEPLIAILAGTTLLAVLLAFGRHFPLLYNLFFDYLPFFNKFRVPSMILFLVQLNLVIMAGFGLQYLLENYNDKKYLQWAIGIFVFFVLLTSLPFLFKDSFSFMKEGEAARYQQNVIQLIKDARYDMMKQDVIRMFLLAAATFVLIFAFIKRWLPNKYLFLSFIVVLLLIDLFTINNRYLKTLVSEKKFERYFKKTATDNFLQEDDSLYRIFPLGELYDSSKWPYRHQSIGGYHPAKLRIIQDINESCLYAGRAQGFENTAALPVNWNIVNMLNVKYLLAQRKLSHKNLNQVFTDEAGNIFVYQNSAMLPRAFFVDTVLVIEERKARFAKLNDPSFNPGHMAILENPISEKISAPDQGDIEITRYEPNHIDINVQADRNTLLVLSEIFYPAGWQAFIDGEQAEIFKTNHVLRSVFVPSGEHKIEFRLQPRLFYASIWVRAISITIVYVFLIIGIYRYYRLEKTKNS